MSEGTAKFSSISSALAPKKKSSTKPRLVVAEEPEIDSDPTDNGDPGPAVESPRPRKSATSSGGEAQVAFRAPIAVLTALREHSKSSGRSHSNVVLDALEAEVGRLSELVAAHQEQRVPVAGALFTRTASRAVTNPVQTQIRVSAQALEVIDNLVVEHKASSRTELFVVALRAYLNVQDEQS